MGHIVDSGAQALLFQNQSSLYSTVLINQPPNDQPECDGYHKGRESSSENKKTGLFAPTGQRRGHRPRSKNNEREIVQGAGGNDAIFFTGDVNKALGYMVAIRKKLDQRNFARSFFAPDGILRIARQYHSVS